MTLGAVVGYSSVKILKQPNENNRGLASVTFSKLGSDHYSKSLFEVKIENESIASKADQESIITVKINALKTLPDGLNYTWNLPETVTVVDGAINGPLLGFSANETKELRLKVKGYSKEVRNYISFTIKGELDGNSVERDVLVSSRPEDSFEYVVQEKEKERAIEKKSFNKMGKPEAKSAIDLNKVSF